MVRVRKVDVAAEPDKITNYYYNNKWQVVCEYNSSDVYKMRFYYGNYVDEVLMMDDASTAAECDYYYLHDHLYSPTVLPMDLYAGNYGVGERCEYDAYGSAHIYNGHGGDSDWWDGDETLSTASAKGNSYLFTGRRLDILDGGSLKIYYYRNRYYYPHTGRFLTHDPLGITPNGELAVNRFEVQTQYTHGPNVYEYAQSMPLTRSDPYGLWYYADLRVVRVTKVRAWVLPDSDQAIYDIDSLATFLRLEPKEFGKWAKYKQEGNRCGWEVPNTAYVVKGDDTGLWPVTILRERHVRDLFEAHGFHVIRAKRPYFSTVEKQFADENIIAWGFIGHGKEGTGALFLDPQLEFTGADAKNRLHHRLAEVILYACEAAKDRDWLDVLSMYGILRAADYSFRVGFNSPEDLPTNDR